MNKTVRAILLSVGIIGAIFLLWYIRSVIAYVLIAAVVSIIGRPLMHYLEYKKKVPAALSAVTVLLVFLIALSGFVMIFIPLVQDEATAISQIDQEQIQNSLNGPMDDFGSWMEKKDMIPEGTTKEQFIKNQSGKLLSYVKVSDVFNYFLSQIGNMAIGLMSILFISFFFLKDRSMIFRTIYSLTPDKNRNRMHEVLKKTKATLTRYFIGICIQITLITLIVTVGLTILGVKHAFLIGFLAGVVNVIPYLGPMIGAFFGILIGITGNLDLDFYAETVPLLIKIVSVFALVQMLDNFLFQPYIFSNSVSAHPLEIFLVILSAGTLAGIVGMVLAIPVYSFIRIVAKEFYSEFTLVQTMTKGMDRETQSPKVKMQELKKKIFKKDEEED